MRTYKAETSEALSIIAQWRLLDEPADIVVEMDTSLVPIDWR
jgi:hypothetical protein